MDWLETFIASYVVLINYPNLGAGAFGIFIGYKFRIASIMFCVPYWYLFLVDRSVWNNHSYLYGLCGLLFMVSNANRFW